MVETSMMTITKSLAAAFAVCALAGCQTPPRPEPTGSVQPQPESSIQWNTPRPDAGAPPAGTVTTTGNATPAGRLPPGATIQWKDQPPSGADSTAGLPPGATWKDQGASGPAGAVPSPPSPSASAPPVARPAPAQPGPAISWRGGLDGDVVQIEIIDRFGYYRVDRVALVSPQGQEYAARELTYFAPSYSRPGASSNVGVGVSSWGGSSSGTHVGLGLGFPLGGWSSSSSSDPDRNAPRTVARIVLPDPRAYRSNPQGWTVRARLLDSFGAASVAQFPAPLPPGP